MGGDGDEAVWVRQCLNPRCGRRDLRERWEIPEDGVTDHPAWSEPWACRYCGAPGFALVERDESAPDAPRSGK
jgi:hypothetical protein